LGVDDKLLNVAAYKALGQWVWSSANKGSR
jgi:hypothetical protein